VFVHALANSTPVVVRMVDSAGLTPGSEAVLGDVRVAGKGRDGTAVYCAAGRLNGNAAAAAPAVAPVPVAGGVDSSAPPPLVQAAAPVAEPVAAAPAAEASAESRCTSRLFNIIKKPLSDKKFGPSEFDAESALGEPEVVDCSVAKARNTNVLLIKMVKDGFSKPSAVLGAEWGPGSTWQKEPDAPQRRVVKVYLAE
jgi:hypothetical protein